MFEWKDTGIEVATPPQFADAGVLGLPIHPQQMTSIYTSDYCVFMIPSPDGIPAHQRGIYGVSGTKNMIRHVSIFEIPPGGSLLLSRPPPELSAAPGDNEIPGTAVQVQFVPVEVQRPGRGPEYQLRMFCVMPNANDQWTLRLLWSSKTGDLPFWWARRLPWQ